MFYSAASADAPAADKADNSEKKSDAASSKADDTSASTANESEAASNTDSTANSNTGSVFGPGSLVLTGTLSAAVGALICFLITRKRRA